MRRPVECRPGHTHIRLRSEGCPQYISAADSLQGAPSAKFTLKWLHDYQDDNADHQNGRYLIDDSIEFLAAGIPVLGKLAHIPGVKPVDYRHYQHQDELGVKPRRQVPAAEPDQQQPEQPGRDHRRVDDGLQQPPFHHLEGLGLRRALWRLAVIDEQPRQIEHAGHPRNHRDDVRGLDPVIYCVEPIKHAVHPTAAMPAARLSAYRLKVVMPTPSRQLFLPIINLEDSYFKILRAWIGLTQRCRVVTHLLSTWTGVVHAVSQQDVSSGKPLFPGLCEILTAIIQRQIHNRTLSSPQRLK